MSILIDILVVLIIVLFAFLGYKKGFMKLALGIISFFAATLIAVILYKPVSNAIINNTDVDDIIKTKISGSILKRNPDIEKADEIIVSEENPSFINDYITKNIEDIKTKKGTEIIETLSGALAKSIITLATFIVLFIVTKLIILILNVFIGFVEKIPFIKQFNGIGGLLYGIVKGLITVYFAFCIVYFLRTTNLNIEGNIQKSFIGSKMYNNNIILKLIK